MSRAWLPLALSSVALFASGCTAFPDIPSGVCGNDVIDAPEEDCDSFPLPLTPGSVCRPKGSVGECHLDCSTRDGKQPSCPAGWGCDSDAICRRPTGAFLPPVMVGDVGAWSLSSADFDGDGRDDVMSSEPLDAIGATRVKFYYFDRQANLADTRSFPKLVLSPTIKAFPGDAPRSDLTFSIGPLGVMLGRADRSWVPETFSSYRIDDTAVRVAPIADPRFGAPTAFISLLSPTSSASASPRSGLYVVDEGTGQLRAQAQVDWGIDDLVGEMTSGNLIEDKDSSPCLDPVFALRAHESFTLLNVCRFDEAHNQPTYRAPLEQTEIALDPPAVIDQGPLIADMNGDGHLDVMVSAGGQPYVSYGDGTTLATATPYRVTFDNLDISPDIPMPVAAGDFSGDGAPDFVFSDRLLISVGKASSGLPVYSDVVRNRLGGPITSAKIADFNGDGYLDVATGSSSSLNVQLFSGAPGPLFSTSLISTTSYVQSLASGDFDGDRVDDLAVLETPRVGETTNVLKIGFGTPLGELVPLSAAAQLNAVAQLAAVDTGGIGGLVMASSNPIAGHSSGAVTLMNGDHDRVLFAPFALTDFSATRSVLDSGAFSVAVGEFTRKGSGDLIALAYNLPEPKSDDVTPMNLWLVAGALSPGAETQRSPIDLDSRLQPVKFLDQNSDFTSDVASASADLDGDGLDEAIFVMPAGADQTQCGILLVGVSATGNIPVAAKDPIFLDDPCADPVVVPVDADGDKFPDLAVLTGRNDDPDRKLYLFWNDGSGGFANTNFVLISSPDDSPQAFTVLPGSKEQPLAFVYVTDRELRRTTATSARVFSTPSTLLSPIIGGTGVTAADVDGDRVKDLVLAQSGRLSVLRAQLEVP